MKLELLLILAGLLVPDWLWAGEKNLVLTIDGITYSNITWGAATPATVILYHQAGVATVALEKLPGDLQERFHYIPGKTVTNRPTEAVIPTTSHLIVELRDGSRIIGDTDLKTLSVATEMTGTPAIPLAQIATLQFGATDTTSVVLLRNGDRLKGVIQTASLKLTTSFGRHTIPVVAISKVSVAAADGSPVALTDGLVLYYSFDTDDGNTVKDLSGHEHNGRVNGARYVAAGAAGGAYQFDGQNDFIRVPTAPELQSAKFSVSVWVNAREGRNARAFGIIGKHQAEDNQSFFVMRIQQNQIGPGMNGSDRHRNFDVNRGCAPFLNQWGMLTLTYDGTTAAAYFNGQLAEQREIADYRGNDYDLLIGALEFAPSSRSPQWFWDGQIDEVRIYNRALSADEVQALYDSVAPSVDRRAR